MIGYWYSNLLLIPIAKCTNFIIDIGFEIIILYERIYEIYGDILAATNSFGIDAYEMGTWLLHS